MTDKLTFSCTACGSKKFVYPNDPPKDDDIITCAGCGRTIGRYDVVKNAITEAGKAEVDRLVEKRFGKKPTWK